ncbi:uncharacterized protein LOC106153631 [Lingula anatina]|uniref:Uncharacterized protein LOC106153631 n=1 Tax=Lingula anatina TaxID=7574 RepID=A0A1S3HAQ5_LINAN|nr:uncharacterized protein LOC106153631 [Lingula anatina]|eukprot:XP_013383083.1 uncharacterized protein LOC106153631 [Lingula anatina]
MFTQFYPGSRHNYPEKPTYVSSAFFVFGIFIIFQLPEATGFPDNDCIYHLEQDVFAHGNTCYHVVSTGKDWRGAKAFCETRGQGLAEVQDRDVMEFLSRTLHGLTHSTVWIGGSDVINEGSWMWTSGQAVTYFNWAQGQPETLWPRYHNEDCMVMRRADEWKWSDFPCAGRYSSFSFICQYECTPCEHVNTSTDAVTRENSSPEQTTHRPKLLETTDGGCSYLSQEIGIKRCDLGIIIGLTAAGVSLIAVVLGVSALIHSAKKARCIASEMESDQFRQRRGSERSQETQRTVERSTIRSVLGSIDPVLQPPDTTRVKSQHNSHNLVYHNPSIVFHTKRSGENPRRFHDVCGKNVLQLKLLGAPSWPL